MRNSSYQKRWFVLKGNLLFYKERRSERELLGVLVLEGCSVQLCESDERFAFSVVWSESHVAGGRVYKLAAEDQSTQESWLKALLSANHAYLQLLLMDLEARYRGERLKGCGFDPRCPRFPSGLRTARCSGVNPYLLLNGMSLHSLRHDRRKK